MAEQGPIGNKLNPKGLTAALEAYYKAFPYVPLEEIKPPLIAAIHAYEAEIRKQSKIK